MDQIPAWQIAVLVCVGGVSLSIWGWLAVRRMGRAELLRYEPRRRVPWRGGGAMLALLMASLSIASSFAAEPLADAAPVESAASGDFVQTALSISLSNLLTVGVIVAWLIIGLRSNAADLGLPRSAKQWRQDMGLGLLTAAAAMLPVYALNFTLVTLLDWHEQHPTLERLAEGGGWQVAMAAFFTAVIAVPIFEEVIFRLLMQGGLEALEDVYLDWKPTERHLWEQATEESRPPSDTSNTSGRLDEEQGSAATETGNPYQSPTTVDKRIPLQLAPLVELSDQQQRERRALVSVGRLPHGWAPILATAALFGLAHGGQGPAPIPLFLFAVMLGYLYQRTHRITPSIFAHMGFNAFSLGMVWFAS